MSLSQFKRALWAMNEIVGASTMGITREALSKKWEYSSMNDNPRKGITDRTFYRMLDLLKSLFNIEIEHYHAGSECRYRVPSQYLEPGDNNLLRFTLSSSATKEEYRPSVMSDILNLIMTGQSIPSEDMHAIRSIVHKLNRIPYETGIQLMTAVEAGEIAGADRCYWDEDYRNYVCVWNDKDYHNTDLWVSIGIYDDRVLFYVVTSTQDEKHREEVSRRLHLDAGEKYCRGYWWFEPTDKSLFQVDFQTFPDIDEIKRCAELLISQIATFSDK